MNKMKDSTLPSYKSLELLQMRMLLLLCWCKGGAGPKKGCEDRIVGQLPRRG